MVGYAKGMLTVCQRYAKALFPIFFLYLVGGYTTVSWIQVHGVDDFLTIIERNVVIVQERPHPCTDDTHCDRIVSQLLNQFLQIRDSYLGSEATDNGKGHQLGCRCSHFMGDLREGGPQLLISYRFDHLRKHKKTEVERSNLKETVNLLLEVIVALPFLLVLDDILYQLRLLRFNECTEIADGADTSP